MADVSQWLEDLTTHFQYEHLRSICVREVGVEPRPQLERTVIGLRLELEAVIRRQVLEFVEEDCLLKSVVDEVVKLLKIIEFHEPNTSHLMEDWLLEIRAAIGAALTIVSIQYDERYNDLSQTTSGSAESLVAVLKKIEGALAPSKLDLSGQTLILVKVVVSPEHSEQVIEAVKDTLSSVTDHTSRKGISLAVDWTKWEKGDDDDE